MSHLLHFATLSKLWANADEAADTATLAVAPEWIHVVPLGTWEGHPMGPMIIDERKCKQIIDNFTAEPKDTVVDYEHQTLATEWNGQPAPAAGWITALELRADGIWGKAGWTPDGKSHIEKREYRYVSPVLEWNHRHWQTGQDVGCYLHSVALTNSPFMRELRPIVNRTAGSQSNMDLKQLCKLLGLPDDGDAAACNARIVGLLGVEAAALDVVGGGEVSTLPTRLAAFKTASNTTSVERLVDQATKDGKITPAQVTWFRALATSNRTAAEAYLNSVKPVVPVVGAKLPSDGTQSTRRLSEAEKAVCKQLNITPEAYLKAKGEEVSQ